MKVDTGDSTFSGVYCKTSIQAQMTQLVAGNAQLKKRVAVFEAGVVDLRAIVVTRHDSSRDGRTDAERSLGTQHWRHRSE